MAGPIGIAVLAGIQKLTCPHCKMVQARGRRFTGKIYCKRCKKPFTPAEGVPVRRHR
jgi:uncharacterized protein YbaR (Trm112 family)